MGAEWGGRGTCVARSRAFLPSCPPCVSARPLVRVLCLLGACRAGTEAACGQLQDEERRRQQQLEEMRQREAEERARHEEERRRQEEERLKREAEEKVMVL